MRAGPAGGWQPHSPIPQNHLQILLLLVFEAAVYRRQEHHRRQHRLAPPPAQAVCADGTRQNLDRDLLGCLKYFVNFFFYKFGLEVRLGCAWPLLREGVPWGLQRTCRCKAGDPSHPCGDREHSRCDPHPVPDALYGRDAPTKVPAGNCRHPARTIHTHTSAPRQGPQGVRHLSCRCSPGGLGVPVSKVGFQPWPYPRVSLADCRSVS